MVLDHHALSNFGVDTLGFGDIHFKVWQSLKHETVLNGAICIIYF